MSSPQNKNDGSDNVAEAADTALPLAGLPDIVTNFDLPETDQAKLPDKGGRRPVEFTPEIRDTILELVCSGISLDEIGEKEGLPSTRTIGRYRAKNPEFNKQVDDAYNLAAFFHDDRALALVNLIPLKFEADQIPVVYATIKSVESKHRLLTQHANRARANAGLVKGPPATEAPRNGDDAKVVEGVPFEVVTTPDDDRFDEVIKHFEQKTGIVTVLSEPKPQ